MRKGKAVGVAIPAVLTALAAPVARAGDAGGPVVSEASARRSVDVTVYNRDLALVRETKLDARAIVEKSLAIAATICIYTNASVTVESLDAA